MRTVTSFAGTAVLIASLLVAPGGEVAAQAAACVTGANEQVNWSDKWWSGAPEPEAWEGASINFATPYAPSVCNPADGVDGFSNAWSMVFNNSNQYFQAGLMYFPASTNPTKNQGCAAQAWSEMRIPGDSNDTYYGPCIANGQQLHIYVESAASGSAYHARSVDGTHVIYTSPVSEFAAMSRPYHIAFSEETWNPSSTVYGSPSNPTDAAHLQVQNYTGDAFEDACNHIFLGEYTYPAVTAYYKTSALACDHLQFWDTRNP